MTKKFDFKYFPDWETWSALTTVDCNCPEGEPCLESAFFEDPDIENPVCIGSLVSGERRVAIPDHLIAALGASIGETYTAMPSHQRAKLAARIVDALSRTPPVRWIQPNQWPVCCGDFCRYLGEIDQDFLNDKSEDGDGRTFLWSILDENCRKRRVSVDQLWEEIATGWTVAYLFECLTCHKLIVVEQSY